MKVRELVEQLQQLDQDVTVHLTVNDVLNPGFLLSRPDFEVKQLYKSQMCDDVAGVYLECLGLPEPAPYMGDDVSKNRQILFDIFEDDELKKIEEALASQIRDYQAHVNDITSPRRYSDSNAAKLELFQSAYQKITGLSDPD